ncbi:TIGR01777 family oxidoreductase [Desulfosarcina sp.]|nr:TIGR01777 family oxidoreductase [Desulfosarcina sp.]
METVLITGKGLIAKHLGSKLLELGYRVKYLSRTTSDQTYTWNIDKGQIDDEAISSADYIIHLAGANISGKRWTNKRKQEIIDSRVKSTQLIFNEVKKQNKKLKAFISASAVGYYGAITSDKIFKEDDPPASDFLGEVCNKWEQPADNFQGLGIRTTKIRIGVVLTENGGALEKMIPPVKMGIGSPIGTGKQYLPWIHVDDLCSIFIKAIKDSKMDGVYNAVAPDFKTNKEFTKDLAKALNKPFWFPNIPAFTMKLMFGEMATILLNGSRVSSEKIRETGFAFKFPDLKNALADILN